MNNDPRNTPRRARRSVDELTRPETERNHFSLRDDPRVRYDRQEQTWEDEPFFDGDGEPGREPDTSEPVSLRSAPVRFDRTVPPSRTASEKKKKKKKKGAPLVLLLLVAVLAGGVLWFVNCYRPSFAAPAVAGGIARRDGVYNFLCLGVDKAGRQADVTMLVQFDTAEEKVSVVQIPRDTYINSGSNFSRINAYFLASYNRAVRDGAAEEDERFRAAVESYRDMLSENLGIVIDRYIAVDTAGFRDVIDAIGGVDFDVPAALDYEDPYQDLYIHLQPGPQHLDGSQAEQYVRFRHDYLGADIARLDAQKMFLTAVFKQFKDNMSVSTAVDVTKAALPNTTTDLSALDAAYFAEHAMNTEMENVRFLTVPGRAVSNPDTGASYYVLHRRNLWEVVNTCLNVDPDHPIGQDAVDRSGFFTNAEAGYIAAVYDEYDAEAGKLLTAYEIDRDSIEIGMIQ